jgi:hypothetical protein
MPVTVSSFEPGADLSGGMVGLNKTNNSISPAILGGNGFVDQMAVNVTFGTISWSGNLNVAQGSTERGSASLTCSNTGSSRPGDSSEVSVTVGSGLNASPATPFTVQVGTP